MRFTSGTELFRAAVVALGLLAFTSGAWAEKFNHSLVKSNPRTAYRTVATIGPGHEVGQEMVMSDLKSSNSKFKVKEEWVLIHFDYVDGSGKHRGTFVDFHEDGSQTYGTFEGTQKTVANADGSWVATWEGKYRYAGGSQTYKNVKGGGTYKGKATSTGDYTEDEEESIEY